MKRLMVSCVFAWAVCAWGETVNECLHRYVDAGRIAGVVSILSDPNGKLTVDCVGWADMENKRPMRDDTMFALFSMTKTFTGAALMVAIDEGKLSLDDKVSKYIPEFKTVKMEDGSQVRELTLRDLTCHITGSRHGGGVIKRTEPLRKVASMLASQPLKFQPGATFSYGNWWIDTAAAALEVAVGEPYEQYLQRKIFDPLGMKDTTFWPNAEQLSRLVKAYTSDDKPLRLGADGCVQQLVFPEVRRIYPAASGGLYSTPRDTIRFTQMLAGHGTWQGKQIISCKTFDTIFTVKQTPANIKEPYTVGAWLYGDWFGHEGAMRTDQRANLRTGHARLFFIQTENRGGPAFFGLKRDWHAAADSMQGTPATKFGN